MSALVLKNEPVSGARAVEISVFDPTTALPVDHDEDITSYLYVRPGTYKYALAVGTVTNCRRALTTSSDTIESVDTGLDQVVMTAHAYQNLDGPFDGDMVIGTVNAGDDIWIIVVDANTVAFASSLANAIAGTRVGLIGGETGAAITSSASTERGIPGKWLYTFAAAEIASDVPEVSVAILGHATWTGGASVTLSRSGASLLDEILEGDVTVGAALRAVARGELADYEKDGNDFDIKKLDGTTSHRGTVTESGRTVEIVDLGP